jgi:hypothetical protein
MAGIEQAFEKFVTRVSGRERSPAEEPLSNYKSYSENELLSSLDAKMPNLKIVDDELVNMPMFKPKDVAPPKSYSPMPVEEYLRRREHMDLAKGGRINYSSGSGLPPVEEDQAEQLFGENIQTVPTGFSFGMNNTTPVYQEGQPPISGGIRDLKNYVNSTMGNMNPQLGYTDTNFGGNISANMNPFTNAPKTYSANAYYGPEQNRYTLGFNNAPTMGAKQLSAGYEGPYGNINLSRSSDPMNRNLMLNLSSSFADGGLTTTTPPDSGPDPQGVESLFKRRYN